MPLRVIDIREHPGVPDEVVRTHGGWDRPDLAEASASVKRICLDVRTDGDDALLGYTRRFDGEDLDASQIRVGLDERDAAAARCDPELIEALKAAADAIRTFHEAQRPVDWTLDTDGKRVGQTFRPIRRVGLYAPGGRGAYPSTVLMTAVPAAAAGVPEVVLCTPPPISDVIMAAAKVAGITEIYRAGGAQAVAAMAYGTKSIPAVDKICGPGNVYVTLAKREVYGTVGIDGLFGPSESLVVADETTDPDEAAAELLTQAEHDPESAAILVTTSTDVMEAILHAVNEGLPTLPRAEAIRHALADHGLAVIVRDRAQAAAVVDTVAPEHLCVQCSQPDAFLATVNAAGTALLGGGTPATLSDYCAGPSHVLPTARTARFSSGLSVHDFLVAINTVAYTPEGVQRDAPVALAMAAAEQLEAHAQAVRLRLP